MIHSGQSATISCKSQVGVVEKNTAAIHSRPLICSRRFIHCRFCGRCKKGASNDFQIPVTNISTTNITKKKNEVIEKLHLV